MSLKVTNKKKKEKEKAPPSKKEKKDIKPSKSKVKDDTVSKIVSDIKSLQKKIEDNLVKLGKADVRVSISIHRGTGYTQAVQEDLINSSKDFHIDYKFKKVINF